MIPQRIVIASIAALGLISSLPALAVAEMTLYKGDPVKTQNINLGRWGSGQAAESQKFNYSGTNSIEVITDGYFSGGRIDFTQPVNLTDAFANRNTYMVIMIRFPGFADEGEILGGGTSEYARGYAVPGQLGGQAYGPKVGFFRIVATVNGQQLVAEDQPIDLRRTESGWTTFSFPLAAFKGNRPSGAAMLSQLKIFGDRPDVFYIGEIRTLIDESEIYLEESPEEQTVSPYDPVQLTVLASGGLASVEYVWDFNKTDGLQDEAYGENVFYSWPVQGDYVVTLRVRDINNVKPELRQEYLMTVAQ